MNKRPVSILIVSALFAVVGAGGIIKAIWSLVGRNVVITGHGLMDAIFVFVSALAALLSGVFMFRGANWARWLCIVWLAFHVVISFGHDTAKLIVHSLLMLVITYLLFRRNASAYFSS